MLGSARTICHLLGGGGAAGHGTESRSLGPYKVVGGGRCAPARDPTRDLDRCSCHLEPRPTACFFRFFLFFPRADESTPATNGLGLTRRLEPLKNTYLEYVLDRQAILADAADPAVEHFSPETPHGLLELQDLRGRAEPGLFVDQGWVFDRRLC